MISAATVRVGSDTSVGGWWGRPHPAARLGLAVQLCTLPWLGFVPDDIWSVPQAAVLRLANQLAVFPGSLEQYGRRGADP
ncbi:DUF4158 domain-containing protein [Actinoallomurus liliacearum]|uniref:DUF4158 domain-containing protein n=1 Tax=Actinoallomurus liliacearum TaxID=1080073 RepID=UPI003CD0ABFB